MLFFNDGYCGSWLLQQRGKNTQEQETETLTDWDKFIQHNMTLYRRMISDIHDSYYVLFSTNMISNTSLHVGRPLLRPFLVAYAEATLARQKESATNQKCWHHFRILIADKWSVVWNECKNRAFLFRGWKVSLSDTTSYRKISWSLEAARLVSTIARLLWNLTAPQ